MLFLAKIFTLSLILYSWSEHDHHHHVSAVSTSSSKKGGGHNNSKNRQFHSVDASMITLLTRSNNIPTSSEEGDDFLSSVSGNSLDDALLEEEELRRLQSGSSSGGTRRGRSNGTTQNKGIKTKFKECCHKLTHYKAKNKLLLTLIFVIAVSYPSVLYWVSIIPTLAQKQLYIMGTTNAILMVGVPIIMALVYFGILFWFYRSKVWIKCIIENEELRKFLRKEELAETGHLRSRK
ncbi:Uncharacterized protein PCOAH_00002220 [Plasmodium coatneyi]|uniref:Uncharacterized protein n=1 Tax=Plasmodium coatneyi TaxID=208452 RepID=A0A1B1DTA2_9APIC|nr:Uncharacterized protein PCOAH_00002220 [Plasmodium coatneyi]ANQ05815.1 Uncharacterized protein PCOAH_00002220 [Plasmodium coatneyi]